MKLATLILLATSTAFAATSVYFTQRASKAEAERSQLAARVQQLEQAREALSSEVQSLRGGEAPAPSPAGFTNPFEVAGTSVKPASPPPTQVRGVFSAFGTNQGEVRNWGTAEAPPPMPPAMRRMMQKQMRESLQRMYEDVGTELDLTDEQTSALLDLLSERNSFEAFAGMKNPQDMRRKAEELHRKQQADLRALLGDDKLARFAEYQKSEGLRQELGQVQEQLTALDVPLKPEQRKQLLGAMLEDRDRYPQPVFQPGAAPESLPSQFNEWQQGREERLLEAAQGVLTSKQMKVFREYQEYQRAMRQRFSMMVPMEAGQGVSMSAVAVAPAESLSLSGGGSTQPDKSNPD
jgi:type II secretory pathway pseudopilin PulG